MPLQITPLNMCMARLLLKSDDDGHSGRRRCHGPDAPRPTLLKRAASFVMLALLFEWARHVVWSSVASRPLLS
jgi:hypothetical protein